VTAAGASRGDEDAPVPFADQNNGFWGSLFRARCVHCGKPRGTWCAECQTSLENIPISLALRTAPYLAMVVGSGEYDALLKDAIRALKYQNIRALAAPLGERLAHALKLTGWQFDVVLPVPLHPSRQQQRGYNQSALIGARVASAFGVPLLLDGLIRQRDTAPQVGLDAQARQANIEGAFIVRSALVGQRVLLIDDVMTTGATLSECANALQKVAPTTVYGAVVASATQT
jgi:ComF family protein